MNFRRKTTLSLLFYIVLTSAAFAQALNIPDANLRNAIRETLNLPANSPIMQATMGRLTRLDAGSRGITDLTGLEFARALKDLIVWNNPISDLTPLARLITLKELSANGCQIVDINPVKNLRQLTILNLAGNQITDITPLAELTQLKELYLTANRITDVSPLADLTELEVLEIQRNLTNDHSPLDNLSLTLFLYDQFCEMPPLPLEPRLQNRSYPSVFAANWIYGHDPRIDLIYGPSVLDMYIRSDGRLAGDVKYALQKRDELIAMNPNMVLLIEIKWLSRPINFYGEDWPYWLRDGAGNIERGHNDVGLIDTTHPNIQDLIVEQVVAVSKCGLFDGIVLDAYRDFDSARLQPHQEARMKILERIRAETRANFLIQVNSNWFKIPLTGEYINGLSMETGIPAWYDDLEQLEKILLETESTLLWAEDNLRKPHINGVAGEAPELPEPTDSPKNRRWVRVLTTLSLTHANGYVNYQVHDRIRDHGFWYDFLKADLGHPVGPKAQLYDENISGFYIREFTNGWAVYNHSGEAQVITLPEEAQGVASGLVNTEHALANLDGEMYLRVKPKNLADVNGDGVVNILDLVVVAQGFGTDTPEADVNEDGVVNVFDLVFVANQF